MFLHPFVPCVSSRQTTVGHLRPLTVLLFTFSVSFHCVCCPAMFKTEQAKGSHYFCTTPRVIFSLMSKCDPRICEYMWDLYSFRVHLLYPQYHVYRDFCKALINCFAILIIPVTLKVSSSPCRRFLLPIQNNPNAVASSLQPVEQDSPQGGIWL